MPASGRSRRRGARQPPVAGCWSGSEWSLSCSPCTVSKPQRPCNCWRTFKEGLLLARSCVHAVSHARAPRYSPRDSSSSCVEPARSERERGASNVKPWRVYPDHRSPADASIVRGSPAVQSVQEAGPSSPLVPARERFQGVPKLGYYSACVRGCRDEMPRRSPSAIEASQDGNPRAPFVRASTTSQCPFARARTRARSTPEAGDRKSVV